MIKIGEFIKKNLVWLLIVLLIVSITTGVLVAYNLSKKLENLTSSEIVATQKTIDSLHVDNDALLLKINSLNTKIEDYNKIVKKFKKLNQDLITKTKTVYIPELNNNRTSRELLSDLEKHRKYIFISDSIIGK